VWLLLAGSFGRCSTHCFDFEGGGEKLESENVSLLVGCKKQDRQGGTQKQAGAEDHRTETHQQSHQQTSRELPETAGSRIFFELWIQFAEGGSRRQAPRRLSPCPISFSCRRSKWTTKNQVIAIDHEITKETGFSFIHTTTTVVAVASLDFCYKVL